MIALVRFVRAPRQPGGIHRVGTFVDIDKHRRGAAISDRLGGGHEGARHRDDFVPGSDAAGEQRPARALRCRCRRPIACRQSQKAAKSFSKARNKGPARKCAAVDYLANRARRISVPMRRVMRLKIKEGDFHLFIASVLLAMALAGLPATVYSEGRLW